MTAVFQVTAAINSYNEYLRLATHERLCPNQAQPRRAFLQLIRSCNFCARGRGGRER